MDGPLIFVVAVLVAVVATPVAARVAQRAGILDHPGALKVQQQSVPYLGGTAVFAAVAAGALAGGLPVRWLVPIALAVLLGVIDDVRSIGARTRLLCECGIGLIAGLIVPAPTPFGAILTAVAVVVLINAVNLFDGLDALASGVVLVSAVGFSVIGGAGFPLAIALVGALAGFLMYNRPPASIYLGDGGSYLLGATLAMLAAAALDEGDRPECWVVVPLFVALPLADTAIAIVRRRRAGRPVFSGDRSHVYDQLVDRGRSPEQAVLFCIAAQLALVGIGLWAWHLPAGAAVALVAVTALGFGGCIMAMGFVRAGSRGGTG